VCVRPVSTREVEDEEAGAMESVIHSELFREELQDMVAKQISDSLQSASQPLYDLISLRQRYGKPDENSQYGTWLLKHTHTLLFSAIFLCLLVPRWCND